MSDNTFKKHKTSPDRQFTIVPNSIIRSKMPNAPFRLLCYLQSNSDAWEVFQSYIQKELEWGDKTIEGAIRYLKEHQYLIVKKLKNIKGIFYYQYPYSWEKIVEENSIDEDASTDTFQPDPLIHPLDVHPLEMGGIYEDSSSNTNKQTNCPVVDSPVGIDAKENIPSKIIKYNMRGEEVSCSLDEIFRFAIQQRKDWKTSEINEAWSVLIEYTGAISKYIEFIAGTIKQKRIEVVSKFNRKKEKKCQDIQIVVKEEVVSVNKGRSLADCMRERALENSCAMNSP